MAIFPALQKLTHMDDNERMLVLVSKQISNNILLAKKLLEPKANKWTGER